MKSRSAMNTAETYVGHGSSAAEVSIPVEPWDPTPIEVVDIETGEAGELFLEHLPWVVDAGRSK